jgi:hypothetical protein
VDMVMPDRARELLVLLEFLESSRIQGILEWQWSW